MKDVSQLVDRLKRGPTDMVGVDISRTKVCAVRIQRSGDELSLAAADVVPLSRRGTEPDAAIDPITLPSKLKARYAALSMPDEKAVIKLLSFPGQFDAGGEAKLIASLRLDNPDDFRIGYKMIVEGHGRSESRLLAAALPSGEAEEAISLLPSGLPAPHSLEISSLATFTAFLNGPGADLNGQAVGAVHFGFRTTTFIFFSRGMPELVRQLNFGTESLIGRVQETLGVDRSVAQGIIADGAFDISQALGETTGPLVKELIISRDFVERRRNCHIGQLFASGGMATSREILGSIESAMGLEVRDWNPFDCLTVQPGAVPEHLAGQEWRFPAAVGACLGAFEKA